MDIQISEFTQMAYDSLKKDFLKSYIDAGMTGIIISIHGFGGVHDYLVGLDGAFKKLHKTFSHIYEFQKAGYKLTLDTNTVLTKYNHQSLYQLFKYLSYFNINRCQIVQLYSLYLFSKREKQNLYVDYKKFTHSFLPKILDLKNIHITLENFPLCKVNKENWGHILERNQYDNDAYGNMGEGFEESNCTYLSSCVECDVKDMCSGIPKDYLQVFKNENFIPISNN